MTETIKIKATHESQGEYVTINKSDFNAKVHEPYDSSVEVAADTAPDPVADDETPETPDETVVADETEATDETPAPEFASDAAKKLAFDANIEAESITGTGTDGKITKPDVEAAIAALNEPAEDSD